MDPRPLSIPFLNSQPKAQSCFPWVTLRQSDLFLSVLAQCLGCPCGEGKKQIMRGSKAQELLSSGIGRVPSRGHRILSPENLAVRFPQGS